MSPGVQAAHWCVRYVGEQSLLERTDRGAMGLDVGGVDQQPLGPGSLA